MDSRSLPTGSPVRGNEEIAAGGNVGEPGNRDNPIVIEEFLAFQENLKKHKYQSTKTNDDNESYSVCLNAYRDGEGIGKLNCGHEFHYHCIWKWLESNITCPLCRSVLAP